MISLIKFTENDKRLLIALLLLVILFFIIVGYLSLFVKKIMNFQAKRADSILHDVYVSGAVKTERGIRKYGIKKNWSILFKQASIPVIILALAWLLFLLYGLIFKDGNFASINLWDYGRPNGDTCVGGEGFNTLFFIHDWNPERKINFWGLKVYQNFPPTINKPHWSWDAWFSYIFIPANAIGICWFLVCVQAYIARAFRIYKLSLTLFKKTLNNAVPLESTNNQTSNVNSQNSVNK